MHHPVELKEVEIGQGMNDIDEKNVSRIRKKTFYSHFCIGTPEDHQKSIFRTSKMKKHQKFI
jgi:hypothetical protein